MRVLEQSADDPRAALVLTDHRHLLRRCRHEGIEAAFAGRADTDLEPMPRHLNQPPRREDMPQRIRLCRDALRLIDRETYAPLWAALQNELANGLNQSPLGDRADNLELAIHHDTQALDVRTRQAFPADWAMTQNNLAAAYSDRIRPAIAEITLRHRRPQPRSPSLPTDWIPSAVLDNAAPFRNINTTPSTSHTGNAAGRNRTPWPSPQ